MSAERTGGAAGGALREVFDYDVTGSLQHMLSSLGGESRAPWQLQPGNVLTREELTRSRDLLREALDAANWDLRAVLPGTPRTDAELREFVSAAIGQIEQLMLTVAVTQSS